MANLALTEKQMDDLSEWSKKHAVAATNVGVTALPDSNEKYILDHVEAGGDVAGSLQINDSDGNAIDGYFITWPAGGRSVLGPGGLNQIPKGKGIRYTTTGGGNHSVLIKYRKVNG